MQSVVELIPEKAVRNRQVLSQEPRAPGKPAAMFSAIGFWKTSKFRDAGRKDCFCSEQDHPEFPVQEEGQSRGTEKPRRRTGFFEEDRSRS